MAQASVYPWPDVLSLGRFAEHIAFAHRTWKYGSSIDMEGCDREGKGYYHRSDQIMPHPDSILAPPASLSGNRGFLFLVLVGIS